MFIECRGVRLGLCLVGITVCLQPSSAQSSKPPSVDVIRFAGSVRRDERFERSIGRNMLFRLDPVSEGWRLAIVSRKSLVEEHRELCEPLHGGDRCDFLGEYFTRNSKSQTYLKSRSRQFGFGLGLQLPVSDQERRDNPDWWRSPNYERRADGTLVVEYIALEATPDDESPAINLMRFRVELRLPK